MVLTILEGPLALRWNSQQGRRESQAREGERKITSVIEPKGLKSL
jgi:hypothetical protein